MADATREPTRRCNHCGATDEAPLTQAQCALRAEYRADVARVAAGLDKPPTAVAVDDLWAHLNTVYEDGAAAHRAALTVLRLGWRLADFAVADTPRVAAPRRKRGVIDQELSGVLA